MNTHQEALAEFVKERIGYIDVDGVSSLDWWAGAISSVLEAVAEFYKDEDE